MTWKMSVKLQGHAADDKRSFTFSVKGATYDLAVIDANQILAALLAASKAELVYMRLSNEEDSGTATPVDASADCFEEAALSVHLISGGAPKYGTLYIPAPLDAMFLAPENQAVDTANAAVQAFIAAYAAAAFISDGDQIDTSLGVNGLKEGWKASRSRSFRS